MAPSFVSTLGSTALRYAWIATRIWFTLLILLLQSLFRAIRRDAVLKPIPSDELELPLLAARARALQPAKSTRASPLTSPL